VLPSRSRLERWNPDSLAFADRAIRDGGRTVDDAVTRLSNNINTMPDTKSWTGDAHDAATGMFERAGKQASAFSSYTAAVGEALGAGAGAIGATRTALLSKADEIDNSGQLHVSEQWVVLITGAQMTSEEAAALEKRAQAEQTVVNGLLLAVGAADDETAADVMSKAKPHGFGAPDRSDPTSLLLPSTQRPGDEVPNPSNPVGFLQQATLRDADMAQTVRDTKAETQYDPGTGEEMATTTTYFMQDGSRHVNTVNARTEWSDRSPAIKETHFDKEGDIVSETTSVTYNEHARDEMANVKVTSVRMADGTLTTLLEHPGGRRSGTITTPDGRHADVPLNLLNHPILTTGSGAISGLEAQAGRGIPMLTEEAAEHVRVGAKYGGPGLSIATALWDVAVADSGFEKCVASAEGVTSVTSGVLAGAATSGAGPWVAVPVSVLAGSGGQALGNWIGNTFCPR
jgi:hypothetical protein